MTCHSGLFAVNINSCDLQDTDNYMLDPRFRVQPLELKSRSERDMEFWHQKVLPWLQSVGAKECLEALRGVIIKTDMLVLPYPSIQTAKDQTQALSHRLIVAV